MSIKVSTLNYGCDLAKGESIVDVFLISTKDLKLVNGELRLKRKYGKRKRKIYRVDAPGFSMNKKQHGNKRIKNR